MSTSVVPALPHLQGDGIVVSNDFDVLPALNGRKVPVFLWGHGVRFEDAVIKQVSNVAKMPFVVNNVALMPDGHYGIGAAVGSVFATDGAVIPAAVGVDIGCGMIAARTNLKLANSSVLKTIRAAIEKRVPMGRTNNGREGDRGAWHIVPDYVQENYNTFLWPGFERIKADFPELERGNLVNHLGTLGTGNHFIELQFDENQDVWIMLHSGSRGPGNRIGQFFIKKAKELMDRYFIELPDKDLAFLPKGEKLYDQYLQALGWAQAFAHVNRRIMLGAVVAAVSETFPELSIEEEINTHHNYANVEKHFGREVVVTRKGAIDASEGKLGIIPGSMGDRSYIVRGRGNPLSFHSCSHGAGRAMSRTEATRRFTVQDHEMATRGVECDKSAGTIDETPAAYKSIDAVIEAERDLVEVVHTLKQFICCKGLSK